MSAYETMHKAQDIEPSDLERGIEKGKPGPKAEGVTLKFLMEELEELNQPGNYKRHMERIRARHLLRAYLHGRYAD